MSLMHRGTLVHCQARYLGDHLALVCGSERLTWRQLDARVNRLADAHWDPDDGGESFIQMVVAAAASEHPDIARTVRRRRAQLDPAGALAANTALLERARMLAAAREGCLCTLQVVPALRNGRKEEYSVAVDTRRPVSGDTVDPAGVGRRCI